MSCSFRFLDRSASLYRDLYVSLGLLILDENQEVIFKWRIVPATSNLGGASDRPDIDQVWDVVKMKLDGKIAMDQGSTMEELAETLNIKLTVARFFSPRVFAFILFGWKRKKAKKAVPGK